MSKTFSPRRLDVRAFAEENGRLEGQEEVRQHARLMAETQGRGAFSLVHWSATGEIRNPGHVHPEIWVHLQAQVDLSLTCQRCLGPVEVPVSVDRAFRFVSDEALAAIQDEQSEEDVLAASRSFDLIALMEDELLMELPLAPRHETCPEPLPMAAADEDFEAEAPPRDNPFALLGKLRNGKS